MRRVATYVCVKVSVRESILAQDNKIREKEKEREWGDSDDYSPQFCLY